MKRTYALALAAMLTGGLAHAELRTYGTGTIGIADNNSSSEFQFNLAGGVHVNDFVEVEIGYSDFGEAGNTNIDITSYGIGLNVGNRLNNNIRAYGIIGMERLEADGNFAVSDFSIDVSNSTTKPYIGIGAAYEYSPDIDFRTNLISHDSADVISIGVGMSIYF